MTWTIRATDFEEVIGRNPENADFSNPQGNYYGLVSYPFGRKREWHAVSWPSFGRWSRRRFRGLRRSWTPDATWNETAPCYGSAAW